jgi:hypothetical protein
LPQFLALPDPEGLLSRDYQGYTTLSRAIVSELLWWRRNAWYKTPHDFHVRDPQATLTTDASETCWGAELVFGFISFGSYWTEDGLTSSNQRETTAVLHALLYFRPMIVASNIRAIAVRTDNMMTVYNLRRQRGKLLQAIRAIFSLLTQLDTRIVMSHVPGVDNDFADALSRVDSAEDYKLLPDVFQNGVQALGVKPSIDLFASRFNHKLARFVALPGRLAGGAVAEDVLMFNWSRETPYVFPPSRQWERCYRSSSETK